MSSTRDIRRRIKSVKNIQQITKAMKMVAAARLRKAQEKALASKPYTDKIIEVLTNVAHHASEISHPLLNVRAVNRIGYLILSADKGLAGAYSSNVIKEALPFVRGKDNVGINAVGRKTRDYFKRRGYVIDREYTGFSERPGYQDAVQLAQAMATAYTSGEYDEIHIVYTRFFSPGHFRPATMKLLPMDAPRKASDDEADDDSLEKIIFEPSAQEVLELLLPKYLETVIYGTLIQSAASELGARMMAMSSATDNAQDLISKLVLNYNKVRQANITREITEIVGGAEALK
jgi:F-type H+-transporting ATPase subunit gamma